MAYDFERRKLQLMRGSEMKRPIGFATFDAIIEKFDSFCKENVLTRSQGIEVAMVRLMDSYNMKKEKQAAIEKSFYEQEMGITDEINEMEIEAETGKSIEIKNCRECYYVFSGFDNCPNCGAAVK